MKIHCLVLPLLLGFSSVGLLQAQTYSDNFNEYMDGTQPTTAANPSVTDSIWSVSTVNSGQTVLADSTYRSPFTADEGNAIHISAGSANTNLAQLNGDISNYGSSAISISIDMFLLSKDGFPSIYVLGDSNAVGVQVAARNNDWAYYSNGTNTPLPNTSVPSQSEWYHVEIITSSLETANDTYSVTITAYNGGTPTVVASGSNLSFRSDLETWSTASFHVAGLTSGNFVIDNFSITAIPEGRSTAILLGLASMSLAVVRFCRRA